ncbi:DUF6463 family protein [Kiloniella laminariae]|uniref:DUF6463 family protein n=1 Tax=Kiloniella laminariae TaxID=454162 RepID=A0ABT4LFG4_9PROT|nr:DUF6463 family protein [Kiloniella laminariae]MCZ4279848.1 DUF6463 family protein [Kiloniella laminariae]
MPQNILRTTEQRSGTVLKTIIDQRWVGRWIMAVALLHIAFTVVLFPEALKRIFAAGFFNSGLIDARIGNTVWFFLFGLPLFLAGYLIDQTERQRPPLPFQEIPLALLAMLSLLGIALLPSSGFWLLIPAVIGFAIKNHSANKSWGQ